MERNGQLVTLNPVARQATPYSEQIMRTDNTRLAATLRVFGAQLRRYCPLEWVDVHRSRESYVRNLENPSDPETQPKPKVTFNFDSQTIPVREVVRAFEADLSQLNADFESAIAELPQTLKDQLRDAVSCLIARACHEALLRREELVKLIKGVPNNAKMDQISYGKQLVRLGKNCSPELRAEFLSKLPA